MKCINATNTLYTKIQKEKETPKFFLASRKEKSCIFVAFRFSSRQRAVHFFEHNL